MFSSRLFKQMFQKHSETEICPLHLCGGGIEEDWQENGYCLNKLETRVFFTEGCETHRSTKQASFPTPLMSQSSPKGLESSDTVPAQCFISLQILPKILDFLAVSVKILERISALKLNRC